MANFNETSEAIIEKSTLFCISYQKNKGQKQPFFFIGKTEEDAHRYLNEWLETGKAKSYLAERFAASDNVDATATVVKAASEKPAVSGKGQIFVGKIWMIHHQNHLRARVLPIEVDKYEKDGYVRGGPKTSFRG